MVFHRLHLALYRSTGGYRRSNHVGGALGSALAPLLAESFTSDRADRLATHASSERDKDWSQFRSQSCGILAEPPNAPGAGDARVSPVAELCPVARPADWSALDRDPDRS